MKLAPLEPLKLYCVEEERMLLFISDTVTVGRSPDAYITFEGHPTRQRLSRHHAVFHFRTGEWYLTDMISTNGTFINGQRLPPREPCVLRPGDQIRFADLGPLVFKTGL